METMPSAFAPAMSVRSLSPMCAASRGSTPSGSRAARNASGAGLNTPVSSLERPGVERVEHADPGQPVAQRGGRSQTDVTHDAESHAGRAERPEARLEARRDLQLHGFADDPVRVDQLGAEPVGRLNG